MSTPELALEDVLNPPQGNSFHQRLCRAHSESKPWLQATKLAPGNLSWFLPSVFRGMLKKVRTRSPVELTSQVPAVAIRISLGLMVRENLLVLFG